MPTINIRPETYKEIEELMAREIKKLEPIEIIKIKSGITFDNIISKMMKEYKRKHNTRRDC